MKITNVFVRIPKDRNREALERLGNELTRVFKLDLLNRTVVDVVNAACVWVGLPFNFDPKGKECPFQKTQLCAARIRFNEDGTAEAETFSRGVVKIGDWEKGVKYARRLALQLLLGLNQWTVRHSHRMSRVRTNRRKQRNRD